MREVANDSSWSTDTGLSLEKIQPIASMDTTDFENRQ